MHPNITEYWSKEFKMFFDPETGVDIDGLWIDMNEPTNASKKIKKKLPCQKHQLTNHWGFVVL